MISDFDTLDDMQMRKLLEAADTTFLNDSMFKRTEDVISENKETLRKSDKGGLSLELASRSQRYIFEGNENSWADLNFSQCIQKHVTKKLHEVIKENYEFCNVSAANLMEAKTKHSSSVKLLKGTNCYVKPYEDFEYDGQKTKPILIKKRIVGDLAVENTKDEDTFKRLAVDGDYILSQRELNTWAKKKERKDKLFHYTRDKNGILHAKDENTELTKAKRKNN